MANKKITELPSASLPLAGSELQELVQGGINVKAPVGASTILTDGNGTTGNGSAIDWGGILSGNVAIDDPSGLLAVIFGGTSPLQQFIVNVNTIARMTADAGTGPDGYSNISASTSQALIESRDVMIVGARPFSVGVQDVTIQSQHNNILITADKALNLIALGGIQLNSIAAPNADDYFAGDGTWKSIITTFRGVYASLAALQAAVPVGDPGNYAFVDAGPASNSLLYIWDDDDADWILGGAATVPDASTTVKGIVELATDAEVQAGSNALAVVSSSLAAWWTWVKTQAQTFAQQITFTLAPIVSSATASQFVKTGTSKELVTVAAATASDITTGTDAVKPITSDQLQASKYAIIRAVASVSAGTMTLDLDNKTQKKFEASGGAISSNFTLALSNDSITEVFTLVLWLTGTIVITLPTEVTMQLTDSRYNNSGTKTLTLIGTTATPFEISFNKSVSPTPTTRYLTKASDPYYV